MNILDFLNPLILSVSSSATFLVVAYVVLMYVMFWMLHLFYIAVMALRDRHEEKTFSFLDKVFGTPTLLVGLIVDITVNVLASPIFLEPPRWDKKEWLLTPRMKRLAALPSSVSGLQSYRRSLARWILSEIDQHDKSGGHNVPPVV